MTLRKALTEIVKVVADEASRNPEFRSKLEQALRSLAPPYEKVTPSIASSPPSSPEHGAKADKPEAAEHITSTKAKAKIDPTNDEEKKRGGRRNPALVDPIALASAGEVGLRDRLSDLDIERLHDVVAEYGMDPGKLVMKWRDRDRVIDRIVEMAMARATKGDAFRRE